MFHNYNSLIHARMQSVPYPLLLSVKQNWQPPMFFGASRRRVSRVNRHSVVYGRYHILATTCRGSDALVGTYAHAGARESARYLTTCTPLTGCHFR